MHDDKTQVRFLLAALRLDGQEQARRQAMVQEGVPQAVLTARDAEQAGCIQSELEKSGANL